MKSIILFLCAGILACNAYADESAKSTCTQPIIPNEQASPVIVKYFDKHMAEYKKCLTAIIEGQQAISKTSQDVATANAAHAKAELTIKEYNDFVELIRQRDLRAGKEEDEDSDKK